MSSDEQQPTAAEQFAQGVLALAEEYQRQMAAARRNAAPPTIRERLNEAGTVRRAWKALEPELPALFAEAEATGRCGAESIAGIVGVTPSYVYRKLREHRAAELDAPITGDAPPTDEYRLSTRDDDQ